MFTKKIQGGITMHFEPSYFNGEERDGFYIAPMMKRAWAAQLEVLHQIDIICKRHNIMYYAEWGTLLGAVRHQGFIPWDDDIDIGMLRKDYVRFLHYAKKELPERYQLLNIHNSDHNQLIVRINNSNLIRVDADFLTEFHYCPYVIGVDLFISDYIPKEKEEELFLRSLVCFTFTLSNQWNDDTINTNEKLDSLQQIQEMCNITFTRDKSIPQQLLSLCDRLCSMYWDTDAQEVSYIPRLSRSADYRFPINYYKSTIEVPFENTTIPIPIAYDQILKLQYGNDYMTPSNIRGGHDYPFYAKQKPSLIELFQKNGLPLPQLFQE